MAEIEFEQGERIRRHRNARDLIASPEVARALAEGWSYREIADALGVSYGTVLKHAKSSAMAVAVERESRRVLNHLSRRKLDTEKYRDLAVSLGVLIDKAQVLKGEPTEIIRAEGGGVDRLAVLLFGRTTGGGQGGSSNTQENPINRTGGIREISANSDDGPAERITDDNESGDELGGGE
jgi:hypothetical protein